MPPRAAARDALFAIIHRCRRTIRRRVFVWAIAIFHPLRYVSQHVVKAERVGFKRSRRRGVDETILARVLKPDKVRPLRSTRLIVYVGIEAARR